MIKYIWWPGARSKTAVCGNIELSAFLLRSFTHRLERNFPLTTVEYISSISWKYNVRFIVNLIGNCLLRDDPHSGLVVLQVLSGAFINVTGYAHISIGSRSAREQDAGVLRFCVSFLRTVAMCIWLLLASLLPIWAGTLNSTVLGCRDLLALGSFSAVSFPLTSFFCYAYLHRIYFINLLYRVTDNLFWDLSGLFHFPIVWIARDSLWRWCLGTWRILILLNFHEHSNVYWSKNKTQGKMCLFFPGK